MKGIFWHPWTRMENSTSTDSPQPRNQTEAQCERCGSFDALELAGQFLCADCVAVAGCGCAGHGEETDG
jgi:hypothetical protein